MRVTPPVPMLIAIYLRVSTEEQARKGFSLPEQREACRQKALRIAAEADGGQAEPHLVEHVDDFGGDLAERPVLEELREFVRARRPAWLVCMDPDRFSRSLKLQLIVADDIEAQGTRLAFVQQEYNPDDMMSKAFFQFRGLMSELDKAKILERTRRGKRGKIRAGKRPNGAAPYGYLHRKETDELEVFEPEAQWVRSAFHWVAHQHMSVQQVTRRLNELGVPTKRGGGQWYRSVVRDLLRNTTYFGAMRCNRRDFSGLGSLRRLPPGKRKPLSARLRPEAEWVAVPVPAIISQELWQLAQGNLVPTARRGGRRDTGLLSMLAFCKECGGRVAYARQYLRCQRRYAQRADYRPGTATCSNPHHRAEAVEASVWSQLVTHLTDPSLLRQYLEQQRQAEAPEGTLSCLEQEHRALRGRLDAECRVQALVIRRQAEGQLVAATADGLLEESNQRMTTLRRELTALEQRIDTLQRQAAPAGETAALASAVAAEAEVTLAQLQALSPALRRALVLKVVRAATIGKTGEVTVALREE